MDPTPKRHCNQFRSSLRPGSILLLPSSDAHAVARLHLNDTPGRVASLTRRDLTSQSLRPPARELSAGSRKRRFSVDEAAPRPSEHSPTSTPTTTTNTTNSHLHHHLDINNGGPANGTRDEGPSPPSSSTSQCDDDSTSSTASAASSTSQEDQDQGGSPPGALPPANMPYTGDFRGCSWNSQALFAHGWRRHTHKMRHAKTLLATHDFVGLQETHSVEGRARMLRLPIVTPRPSTPTARPVPQGSAYLLRRSYSTSTPITDRSWVEVEPGRAAILRLDGHLGSLDLCVVYLHTGAARAQRDATKAAILRSLRPQGSCLSLLFGDWNFVADDRSDSTSKTPSGQVNGTVQNKTTLNSTS